MDIVAALRQLFDTFKPGGEGQAETNPMGIRLGGPACLEGYRLSKPSIFGGWGSTGLRLGSCLAGVSPTAIASTCLH